ncbi:MAG TPA: SAM-dependent chlorinase/fluorinase [Candidatus Limnocylindrales bacterium]|nr:SAM-dependent chlorinase/fluorinase [Candidatus Limnocylindrales bacterium]
MRKPILTLTTDFGLSDHYVGTMKGVILAICPEAQLVDISHGVQPFAIEEGAYLLAQTYRYFPKKTVHVVVVDPGVGTARRPILMEAAGQYFIAPDNGVLAMIDAREKNKVRLISNEKYFLHPVSKTFHGRDIFSPVGAHIAAGVLPSKVGKLIDDYVRPDFHKPTRTGKRTWSGRILKIDRFGNIITNFHRDDFPDLETRDFHMTVGRHTIDVLARNYAETGPGELFLIWGSGGYLEISLAQASAAAKMKCDPGAGAELVL